MPELELVADAAKPGIDRFASGCFQQFPHAPHVIGDPCRHRRDTQGAVDATQVVEREPTQKASVGKRVRHVASTRARSRKKASPARKAHKRDEANVRGGSRPAKILDPPKRPGGATAKELQKASGWQPHSVRGFLSGTIGKKMGLTVTSAKSDDGERRYSVK